MELVQVFVVKGTDRGDTGVCKTAFCALFGQETPTYVLTKKETKHRYL